MPRSGKVIKREVPYDTIYNSKLLSKLINRVMKDGKKTIAQNIVYKALARVEKETGQNPLSIFEAAVLNISPKMEVRPRRVGGASYMVPMEVRGARRESLAIRWLIIAAKAKPNSQYHTFDQKLAAELVDAAENKGAAVKKKEDAHKAAEANRAFAHFRWG